MLDRITRKNFEGVSLALLLMLSVLTIGAINNQFDLQNAVAAGESVTATKPNFFGSNVVEITIVDDDLEDNEEADEITVGFDVQSGSDQTSDDFALTGDAEVGDSGRFVFYITADIDLDEDTILPTDLLEDPEFDDLSEIITISEGGDIDIGSDADNDALDGDDDDGVSLNEGATIAITYGDASLNVTFQDDKADVTLDRTTVGSEGFVYLKIDDQDANNDPTGRDELDFDGTDDDALSATGIDVAALGQTIADEIDADPSRSFKETGDNTGIFEYRLSVEDTFGLTGDDTPVSVTIELQDFEVFPNDGFYDDAGVAGIDGEDDTKESILVDNSDGIIQEVTSPASPRSELKVIINDSDRNLDSKVKDRIVDSIAADLSSGGADDDETLAATPVDLIETGTNTGLFVPDLAGNVFEVTIDAVTDFDGIVQIEDANAAKSDLLVSYGDLTPDDADEAEKTILFKGKAAANTPAVISLGQKQIGPQDKVFVVITDPDLNDDKDSVDSFELDIVAGSFDGGILEETDIFFNGIDIANLELESVISGEEATDDFPVEDITLSFQETAKDTGIFAAEFEYEFLAEGGDTDDGDNTEFTWDDQLLDAPLESSVRLTINEPDVGVSWQQNEYAVPYVQEDRGTVELGDDFDGKRTRIKLFVNDPALNQDSSTVEQWEFSIVDDAGDVDAEEAVPDATPDAGSIDAPDLMVRLVAGDGDTLLDAEIGEITACGGMGQFQTFTETGANTGIFDRTFDFNIAAAGACDLDPNDLTNARLVADYEDSRRSTVLKGNSGILKTSSKTINSGQEITITVTDPDQNHDRDVREQVEITFEPDGLAETEELLEETELNSGVFTKKFVVGEDFEIIDDGELVDDVTVRYIDAVTSDGSTGEERELILSPPSSNGKLTINPESGIGPNTEITITLVDIDLNQDPNSEDTIDFDVLEIKTDNNDVEPSSIALGEDGLQLEETDNNSGEFELIMTLVPITPAIEDPEIIASGDELDFAAEPGDTIAISYEDENHDENGDDVINIIIKVESFDPEFSTDKAFYIPGDTMTVSIIDPDANWDPEVTDVIDDIQVYTDRDAVGESFEAVETGANTGIFTFQAFIVENTFEADSVTAEEGDTIIIEYNDQFPADYGERIEEVDDPDKDFFHRVPVGEPRGEASPDTTTPSAPTLKDVTGDEIDEVTVGQQVVLSTTIQNNIDDEQPFVALIEVRDSKGITVYLAWQTGTLNSEGEAEVGLSFTPQEPGTYTIRTFVISDLGTPEILSELRESEFTVS